MTASGEEALASGSPGDPRRTMAFSVAAGATEIQLNLIASRFLGLPRE